MKIEIGPYPEGEEKRVVNVQIDPYDTWSMDHTLALIILPMLKQLRASNTRGAPMTDDEDVPEELRSTSAPAKRNQYDVDDNHFVRWEWILDEMIWTFSQLNDHDADAQFYDIPTTEEGENIFLEISKGKIDHEGLDKWQDRIKNGTRLFGKYYQNLWD